MNNPRSLREGFMDDNEPFDRRPVESPYEREPQREPRDQNVRQINGGNGERERQAAPEPQPQQPPLQTDVWPLVIKLRKPIMVEKDRLMTEVSLREPTTSDIINAGGNPCRIDITRIDGNNVTFNPVIDDAKMLKLIADLADITYPFIKRLDPRDYNTIAYQLRRFFLPEGPMW